MIFNYERDFKVPVTRIGMFTLVGMVIVSFFPFLYIIITHGQLPSFKQMITGAIMAWSAFGVFGFVEPISYYAVLGLAGTYMSFLVGSVSNVRLPSSAIAQDAAGVESGTPQADIIGSLGIAGSIFVSTSILTLGAIGGAALVSAFPPIVTQAFKFVVPAVFGAIFAMFAAKFLQYGGFAIVLAILMVTVFKGIIPVWLAIIICTFGTAGFSKIYYSSVIKKRNTNVENDKKNLKS